MFSSAEISECGFYRYRLMRQWDRALPTLFAGLINPSTADHTHDDQTVKGLVRRAKHHGFGALVIWNPFAIRSTDPSAIFSSPDPVGPENDRHITQLFDDCASQSGSLCMVGWSRFGSFLGRASVIEGIARNHRVALHCVATNADGSPRHPLYVAASAPFLIWQMKTSSSARRT